MPSELLQFLGSLLAIFALAGLAWCMKLGGRPELTSDAHASEVANEAMDGFVPVEIARDQNGAGAILADAEGRLLVLKPHGNKFAGRVLSGHSMAIVEGGKLKVDSGESRYGAIELNIGEAEAWAQRINALKASRDA